MFKKVFQLFAGTVLASFGIASVVQSGLGCMATTVANFAVGNWLNISVGMAGFLIEVIVLMILLYLGEGVSLTGLVNMSLGSVLIDVFIAILPSSKFIIFGLLLAPIGWMLQGMAGLGESNNNLLMTAILKRTKMKIWKVKAIQEFIYVAIGLLGARERISLFTVVLSFGLGYLIQFTYKVFGFNPTEVEHKYLIKGKERNLVKEGK